MTNTKENKMGVQPVGKLLAGMAIPMMISMLVQAFYNVVDSIFVSECGSASLIGVGIIQSIFVIIVGFGAGFTWGSMLLEV